MNIDLHNTFVHRVAIPCSRVADNTALVGQVLDLAGFEGCEIVLVTGNLADADATFAVTVDHGNAANLSDAAAVPADDLIGTLAQASFTFSSDNVVRKIGYKGIKRYVRVTVTPTNNSGNADIAAIAVLASRRLPNA